MRTGPGCQNAVVDLKHVERRNQQQQIGHDTECQDRSRVTGKNPDNLAEPAKDSDSAHQLLFSIKSGSQSFQSALSGTDSVLFNSGENGPIRPGLRTPGSTATS